MTPRMRARPPSTLPAIQPHQLGALVDRDHAVDLPVRVRVVLALEVVLAVDGGHVHGRHRTESRGLCGRGDARAPVARAVNGNVGNPAFVQAELDEPGQGVVVGCAWAVVRIEVVFEGFTGSPVDLS